MDLKIIRNGIMERKPFLDNLFLCIFACYYFYIFLGTTMIDTTWFVPVYRLSTICAAALLGIKLLTIRKDELIEWGMAGLLIVSCALCWRQFGDKSILILGIFIVAAKDVPLCKIVSVSFVIGAAIMLCAFAGSQLGLVEDLVYYIGGTYRHAFGISYTTDFAAHVLFLVLEYAYLKRGQFNWLENGIIVIIALLVYFFSRAKTNVICMLLTVFLLFCYQKRERFIWKDRKMRERIKQILIFSVPICAIAMAALTWGYQKGNYLWDSLDSILSGRLAMGHEGMIKYGFSLFGRAIAMTGWGRTTVPPEHYFAIDSSYIVTLLGRGVIIFMVMLLLFTLYARRIYKNRQGFILILFAIVALQCMIEHHWLDVSYNFFLMAYFAGDYGGTIKKKIRIM